MRGNQNCINIQIWTYFHNFAWIPRKRFEMLSCVLAAFTPTEMFTRECFGWCLSLWPAPHFLRSWRGFWRFGEWMRGEHPRIPGNLGGLDSKVSISDFKRAPLHCETNGSGVKETWMWNKIRFQANTKAKRFKKMWFWFENLASRFFGNRSRVWAREGKSGLSLDNC